MAKLAPEAVKASTLAGDRHRQLTALKLQALSAPEVVAESGWFAADPPAHTSRTYEEAARTGAPGSIVREAQEIAQARSVQTGLGS